MTRKRLCADILRRSKMKTNLYVSDLDGTLLRSNEMTSDYTNNTINMLVADGKKLLTIK